MEKSSIHFRTFERGSKTYFNSSRFFPRSMRDDVFLLYGFVRTADDFVDAVPQDGTGFRRFRDAYREALGGKPAGDEIIDGFVELSRRRGFDPAWAEAFLSSMEMDLSKSAYATLDETLSYVYGSAEVIGLFMSAIMGLPEEARFPARMLGRAMQYINFIRDIDEDNGLGRRYLPLEGSGLASLDRDYLAARPDEFKAFHRSQIALYEGWQEEAEKGYRFIPRRMRVPIKTAADMYLWTASVIAKNPFVVFERKVKPAKGRIIARALWNALTA